MRIGIVAPEFPPDVGGVETYAYEFSAELARRGHEVFVFTRAHTKRGPAGCGFQVIPELTLKHKADRLLPKAYSMDAWHVMNAAYAWFSLENESVVVSVHGNDFISPYYLAMGADLPRVAGLWRIHSRISPLQSWLWSKKATRLMSRGLSRARQVLANSEYTKRLLVERYPVCKARTSVAFVGVGQDFLHVQDYHRVSDGTKRLLTVCRLTEPRKNVDKVLQALAQLKNYSFKYTVVGEGTLRDDLESLCRELALDDRVSFTGFLPKASVQRLLTESDLFVLTSGVLADSIEGFGIVYLEANACGTPVLAARTAGAAEAVREGKSGYFVEEPTVPAIAAALQRFLTSEVCFDSEECKAFASRFSWAGVVDRALPYYRSESLRQL
jgi:phosphatidyl-myo-inositol dimannoside synthase